MKPTHRNPLLRNFVLAATICLTFAQTTHAASLTWDGNGNTAPNPDGGTGTWDTDTTANWWNGASNVNWPASTSGDDDALFSNTAGTVTVSSITANDLTFSTTGYILSGASTLTLDGTTPTISVGTGLTATIGNLTATDLAGSAGLTKADAGTLNLNGSAVNSLTGGVTMKGGTLALNLNAMGTPTDILNSGNTLTMYNGGTISVTGKNGAFNSAQTLNGTTAYIGNSAITVNNATGTSTTLTLGTISQAEVGAVLSMYATNGGTLNPNTTSQIVKASNTTLSFIGSWAIVGDSKGGSSRWAYVDASNRVVALAATAATANLANVTSASTVYNLNDANSILAANGTAFAVQDNNLTSRSTTLGGFTFTTNGIAHIRADAAAGTVRSFIGATGAGGIVVGAGNELVVTGRNNVTVSVPILNGTAGNSNLTYAGGGTLRIDTAASSYSGQTTVNSGIVQVGTGGSINLSSAIKVNGGKLLQTNAATAISPTVTVQGGTVDGTGTISTVNVTDLATNKITNGNATTSPLTIGALTFSGDAAVDVRTAGSAGLAVTTLNTTPANGTVTINVPAAPVWTTGSTYNLISYGTLNGNLADFTKGTIVGLGARQIATLGNSGSAITLAITGDSVVWTGAASANWTTTAVGTPFNWKTSPGNADTEFLASDDVIFDDSGSNTAVNIADATVSPNTITFNNSTKSYTISGGGIATGLLVKNGTNTTTLANTNTYTGTTTINDGTLAISSGSAIADTGLVSLANAASATFDVTASETIGSLSGGGATGGAVSITSGQILTLSSGTQTYAGTVSGAGALAVAGANQTLNGAVSPGGGISVTSGRLTLGASNSITGVIPVSAGAAVIVTANNALGSTGTGNETTLAGAGGVVSGALGLSGGITYSAAEKIIGSGLSNTAAVNGFAAVQRGIVQSVSGNNTFAGPIEISSAGITRFGTQTGAQLTLSGPITLGSGVIGVNPLFRSGDNNGDYVTLTNTGNNWDLDTLVFSGGTSGNSGLRLGVDNALPTTVSVAGATSALAATSFDLAGYDQSLNGLVTFNATGILKIINSDNSQTSILTLNPTADKGSSTTSILDGAGAVALVKQGSFSQTLTAANNYTGTTTIQGGSLLFGNPGSLYNANSANWTPAKITVESGASLGLRTGALTEFATTDIQTIIANLTTGISNNGLKAGSSVRLDVTAPTTYSNAIPDSTGAGSGAVGLVKTGASTLTLDVANSYSGGTQLNDGYLTASHNNALGSGTLTLGAGAERLNLASGVNIPNNVIINGSNAGVGNGAIQNLNLAANENVTVSGTITLNNTVATGGFFASKNGGTLNLNGAITSTGPAVSLREGTVVFSGGGSFANMGVSGIARLGADNGLATNASVDLGSYGATGTLDLAGKNQSLAGITKLTGSGGVIGNSSTTADSSLTITGTSTFAGVIQDVLDSGTNKVNLTMNGAAQTLTLGAANTYSGTTTVNAGTLALGLATAIQNSPVITVAAGSTLDATAVSWTLGAAQTLKGNGTVSGTTTLAGTVAPGTSVGTLNVGITAGTTALTGTYACDVNSATADLLAITGDLDITGATLTLNAVTPTPGTYTIASYSGALTGTFTPSPALPGGYLLDYSTTGQIKLTVPGTATPYETWGTPYGLTAGSEGGDLDNDGLTNQQEFAFGLIPNSGSSVNPITVQLSKTTGQFTYQRLAASGLSYTIWTSPDLAIWTEDTGAVQNASATTPNQSVEVTLSATVPLSASKLFVRVKAE